jgi:hypothetical protein
VVGIRVLAGGALFGSTERHPIASPPPEPIGSAISYDADVARAQRLLPLVKEGFAASPTEAATRFAISHSAVGTILVGMATPQQFEEALAAVQKGPLPSAALRAPVRPATHVRWRVTVIGPLSAPHGYPSSLRQPPDRIAEEQADGCFPALAIRRGGLGVTGPGDLGEFVLTHHDGQHDFPGCASLAQHAGTLCCGHRHWWSPMKHQDALRAIMSPIFFRNY